MPFELPRLIVNADDFGYTSGVNRAILELYRAGVLSSATLMATGDAVDDVLAQAPRLGKGGTSGAPGSLGIGCHIVLVDGRALGSREELPTLADPAPNAAGLPRGAWFRPALGSFVADLLRGRIREVEIEQEAIRQIRLLQAHGVAVTHLDTHKHTHMFPRVLRPLLRAALQCGVKAIRNPFEQAWSRHATPGALLVRRAEVRLLVLLQPEFTRLVKEAGMHTTAGAIGVLATGTLDASGLEQLLHAALRETASQPDATWELVCHPGYHDAALAAQPTRLLAAREQERSALLEAKATLGRFTLVHFGDLARP